MELAMHAAGQGGTGQSVLWNGSAGRAWVEAQVVLDAMYEPFEDRLLEAVAGRRPRRILDVGCGTGATPLAIAQRLGPASLCTGVDISGPMIDAARTRAGRVGAAARFIRADAQDHAFAAASFDMIVSRFGVMFFEDAVAAFANLRRAATDDAGLCFFAWRGAADNPFMTAAERAARRWLPDMPAIVPDAPGQFAFADRARVGHILDASGWVDVDIEAVDVPCRFPASALMRYIGQMGPLGRVLHETDEGSRARIIGEVRPAFDPYVAGDEVRFTAACWRVSARSTRPQSKEMANDRYP